MAGFHHILYGCLGRWLGRAEEVRGEGRRGRVQEGTDRRGATCEVAYADLGEAALNYLGEVGIRAKLRPLANSLLLAAVAMAFWLLVGIPSGILAAVRVGRFWDSAGKMFALLGLSLPSFLVGLVLILVFSVFLGWLPSSGSGSVLHIGCRGLLL